VSEIAPILTAIGMLVVAITGLLNVFVSLKTSAKVEQVHIATNSMKDQLVAATRSAATAEGIAAGRTQVHDEIKAGQAIVSEHEDTIAQGVEIGRAQVHDEDLQKGKP